MASARAVAGLLVSTPVRGQDVDRGWQLTIVSSLIAGHARRASQRGGVDLARNLDDLVALAHRAYTLAP